MLEYLKILADDTKISASQVGIPTNSANSVLTNSLNAAYFVAGIVAVIVIILAAFSIVTSGSSPDKVAKARNWILYAVVGIVVIILAAAITNFVIGSI